MAKITILTSVYNKAPWLRKCFDSFMRQTFTDLEFLVVNNGSSDDSIKIIDEYCNKDSRFRVINLNNNIGPGGGYGLGIDNVQTEYFGICDCDDYLEDNYIEVLYRKIIEYDADISMCTNDMVWENGAVKINNRPGMDILFTEKDIPKLLPQILDHNSNIYLGYYLKELGVIWGKLYKTSFVKINKINYSQDDWLWCDWLFHFNLYQFLNRMIYTEDTCYHFFQSEGSVTRSSGMNWNKLEQIDLILNKFYFSSKSVITPQLHNALYKFFYWNYRIIFEMYVSNYPNNVSKKELKEMTKVISGWPLIKDTRLFCGTGLSVKNRAKIIFIRYGILWPFLKKRGKRK